jgi:hypothetical protein
LNTLARRFEIISLALPADCAPESVPRAVDRLIPVSWPGMSRVQLADRARRLDLRASLRVQSRSGSGGLIQFRLLLSFAGGSFDLIAHARRVVCQRAAARRQKPSLPPVRDARQQHLFQVF